MNLDKPFLSAEEAAVFLCTSVATMKNSRSKGVLLGRDAPEFIQVEEEGRKVVYEREDLVQWMRLGTKRKVSKGSCVKRKEDDES